MEVKKILIKVIKMLGIILLCLFWLLMFSNGEGPRGGGRLDVNGVYK